MSKQLFFKLKGQKLCPLSKREQLSFAENLNLDVNNEKSLMFDNIQDELFISFAHDKSINDIIVYIWADRYSISLSYNEFIALYNIIKNKDAIENMIIADGI